MEGFGVSVYPDLESAQEIHDYLKLASKYGCKYVFSSMFSVEGTDEEILDYFRKLIADARGFGMKVVLDLNPPFLKRFGVTPDDVHLFHELGCDVMRMDMSFGQEGDLRLVQNPYGISIMFNASGRFVSELKAFKENHVPTDRVLLGHNFYPQPYTGLTWDFFRKTNAELKEYGYPVQAFVSSNAKGTNGVWDAQYGLPTVEMMRYEPIDLQARLLQASGDVDMVWIGNAFASEEEMKAMQEVLKPAHKVEDSPLYGAMRKMGYPLPEIKEDRKLRVVPDAGMTEKEHWQLFDLFPQADAGDSSEWIWRSRAGRFLKPDIPVRVCAKKVFDVGDVLIVNNSYQHYAGEIQIVRIPFENDGMRNLLGYLAPGEEKLLNLIKDGDVVTFLEEK